MKSQKLLTTACLVMVTISPAWGHRADSSGEISRPEMGSRLKPDGFASSEAQQAQVEDVFADFFATLVTECPTPSPGPADNFELAYAYDHRFSPRNVNDGSQTQKGPLAFSYFPNKTFTFGAALDTFISKTASGADRITGIGNASLNFFYDVAPEGTRPIPLSLYYALTIPSASVSKGLGRGRFDHLVLATIPKTFGSTVECGTAKKNKLAVDLGLFLAGRRQADGYASIGLLNLVYERRFGLFGKHRFHLEVDSSSRSGTIGAEVFGLSWIKFQTSKHTSLRFGSRFGITSNSPRFGFFVRFGVTGNLGQVFKTT